MYRNLAAAVVLLPSLALAQTAPISNSTAVAKGGTTARTLADRFTDVRNVVDWGAKCDGVTDDTAVIKATLDAAAGRSRVYVPDTGSPCMVGSIFVPSESYLIVDGTLKMTASTSGFRNMVALASVHDVTIEGRGTLDGNLSQQTGGATSGGIVNSGSISNIRLRGITVTNFVLWALNLVNATDVRVSYVKLTNSGYASEFAAASTDCWADHITVSGMINDYGFAFYGGVTNSGITNSFVSSNHIGGIVVLNDTGQTAPAHDILIQGNHVILNRGSGVTVFLDTGGTGVHYNIKIDGNDLGFNNQGDAAAFGGVRLLGAKQVQVTNNLIHNDGHGTAGSVGVNAIATVSLSEISGNVIWDEGEGDGVNPGGLGVGISVSGLQTSDVKNNKIFDDKASNKTMAFDINGSSGIAVNFIGNTLHPSVGAEFNVTLGSQNYVLDNPGYNPIGVKLPAVPATTVPFTNPYGAPATIYLVGGTMTSVKIASTTLGTGAGTYRIGAGQTVTLAYTGAPTWTWMVE